MKAKKALSKREARKNVVRVHKIDPNSAAKRDTMRGAARRGYGTGHSLDEHRDVSVEPEETEDGS